METFLRLLYGAGIGGFLLALWHYEEDYGSGKAAFVAAWVVYGFQILLVLIGAYGAVRFVKYAWAG